MVANIDTETQEKSQRSGRPTCVFGFGRWLYSPRRTVAGCTAKAGLAEMRQATTATVSERIVTPANVNPSAAPKPKNGLEIRRVRTRVVSKPPSDFALNLPSVCTSMYINS